MSRGSCTLRATIGVLIVVGYVVAAAVLSAHAWYPGRAIGVLVESPQGSIAGAGSWNGTRWAVVSGSWGSTAIVGDTAYNITRASNAVACGTPWGVAVAGASGRDRVLIILGWEGGVRELSFRVAGQPRSCSYRDGTLAVLLSHPVFNQYILIYNGGGEALLLRLSRRAAPSQPVSVSTVGPGTVVVGGKGYYLVLRLDGDSVSQAILHKASYQGEPVTVTGAAPTGEGLAVYGYAGRTGNYTGLVKLPGEGWMRVSASAGGKHVQTRVHAALSPYPGTLRVVVEQVGHETDIVDIRGGRAAEAKRLSILAPYIFRYSRPEAGMLLVAGDAFIGRGENKTRTLMALLIGSNTPMDVGTNETMVLAILSPGPRVWLEPAQVVENSTTINGTRIGVSRVEASRSPEEPQPSSARAAWMSVVVDRRLLACAALAAMLAYSAPVAAAIYTYNLGPCRSGENVGRRA